MKTTSNGTSCLKPTSHLKTTNNRLSILLLSSVRPKIAFLTLPLVNLDETRSAVTSIAELHEFSVDDTVAHEWADSEFAHAELAPWFKSSIVDPFNAESDAPLRSALLRRVVADCERAGSMLKRSRSSSQLLTPRNRSPSFGSRQLIPPITTPGVGVSSSAVAGAAVGGGTASTAPTPASPAHHVTALQASGEGDLDAFHRSHDLTIEDSESDLDDAFDAIGDISSRFFKAGAAANMRSPRRQLSSRSGVPMLTLQALQSLATPASALGGMSASGTSGPTRKALHRRSDSGDDLSASQNAIATQPLSSNSAASRSAPRLMVPLTQPSATPAIAVTNNNASINGGLATAPSVGNSSAPAIARTRPVVTSSSSSRRAPAGLPGARSRVDPSDFSVYADVGRLRMETPHVVVAAPQFVSLATGSVMGERTSGGDYWMPDTPYRPRPGEPLRASHVAVAAAAASVTTSAPLPCSPPFMISRTGEWLKSN
jgi:hypothetical protein